MPQPGQYLAGVPVAEFRQLDILLTPHGFLQAAMAAKNPTADLVDARVAHRRGHAEREGDARLVHRDGQVPGRRDVQRPESARAGPHVGSQPRLRRHAVRAALLELQGFRRREVPDDAAHPPGRPAAERGAQLDGDHADQRPAEHHRPGDAGAGRRCERQPRRRCARSRRSWPTASGSSPAARTTAWPSSSAISSR